jgi:hypothetical protein
VGQDFEQRYLEAEFGQYKIFEPHPRRGKTDAEFFLPKLNFFDFEFVSKSYGHFTEPLPSYGFEGAVPTRNGNQVKQRRCKLHGEGVAR